MNRVDLQKLAEIRRGDARALLESGRYAGTYYLAGYAIECALKACIAKQIKRYDFPDKKLINEAHTHDLEKLVRLAGLATDLNKDIKASPNFELNWTVVKDWSEKRRYDQNISKEQAKDIYSACVARKYGLLAWIRVRW